MKRNSEFLAFRVDPSLRKKIEKAAAADRRPVASLIRNIMANWIATNRSPDAGDRQARA
jgi:hypothetical protein